MTSPLKSPKPAAEDGHAILSMVNAIEDEVYLLANQIAELGEVLSKACAPDISPALSQHLQLFDSLCQRALTQARLLHGVGFLLSGRTSGADNYLRALIEEVPFEQDRQRLSQAMGGSVKAPANPVAGPVGELDWF